MISNAIYLVVGILLGSTITIHITKKALENIRKKYYWVEINED